MADISTEIQALSEAVYGEEVRSAMVSAMNKINTVAETQEANVEAIIEEMEQDGLPEVVDIRVGYDGTTYDTAGDAVRGQVGDLKNALLKDLDANINVSPRFEQGFWSATPSTTRQDYVRTKGGISVAEGDVVTVDMNGYIGTEVQFNYYSGDTYTSRTTVRIANFQNGCAKATTPTDVNNVRINIYSGGSSIYINPNSYLNLQIYKNLHTSLLQTVDSLYTSMPIQFEVGLITIASSDWYFPNENTTKRIRTIANETIRLYNGDKIKIKPNKSIRAFIAWVSDDGVYGSFGWFNTDRDITVDGEYVIAVGYNPDRDITDFNDLASSVYIEREYGKYVTDLELQKSKYITQQNNFNHIKRNVRSINHRGWYTAPENTIVAFAQSKYYGFDCVETDIRATSDGVFVLLHDNTIDRTSNGTGDISQMTYADVLQYDFGSYKASKYAGTKIPTLEELLNFCKWTGVEPYLEVKNVLTDAQIRQVVDIVNSYGMLHEVTFFGDANVADVISAYNSTVRVGIVLFADVTQSDINSISAIKERGNSVFLDAQLEYLTDGGIALAKSAGIPLEAWNAFTSVMANANPYISGYTSDNFVASLYMAKSVYNPML